MFKMTTQPIQEDGTLLANRKRLVSYPKRDDEIFPEVIEKLLRRDRGTLSGEVTRLMMAGESPEQISKAYGVGEEKANECWDNFVVEAYCLTNGELNKRHRKKRR
jgi:hypothetical protein